MRRCRVSCHSHDGDRLVTIGTHDVHQIEYAIGGVVDVETAWHCLLPPQQAAIPVGLHHQATMKSRGQDVGDVPSGLSPTAARPRPILAVSPVIREMMLYGQLRWPIGRWAESDPVPRTLADLVIDVLDQMPDVGGPGGRRRHGLHQGAPAMVSPRRSGAAVAVSRARCGGRSERGRPVLAHLSAARPDAGRWPCWPRPRRP